MKLLQWFNPKSSESRNYIAEETLPIQFQEKTFQESALVNDSLLKPYPPDDLWQKRGDWSAYEDMKKDDQVSVALQLKKDLVLGSGWEIVQEEEKDLEIKEFLESSLDEDPDRPLEEMLEEILSAYDFGFSLSEKIFKKREDGKIVLKVLKTRHPDSWLINTDPHGNINSIKQRGVNTEIEVDPKTLIHYVNKPLFDNPYGTSDLRACYGAWFTKLQIVKYYAIFMEKYASPIPVGKFDKNAPQSAVDKIFDILKRFQAKTAITIPKDVEVEFLEMKGTGDVYVKSIDLFNMFIGRSLLIPDLLGFQGRSSGGAGSQALGREQVDIFLRHINRRRKTLERLVNLHIIQPMVINNFGFVEDYPKFQFKPVKEEDTKEYAKIFIEAMRGKMYKPTEEEINKFRTWIAMPEGPVEFNEPLPMPGQEPNKPGEPTGEDEEPEEKQPPPQEQEAQQNNLDPKDNPFNPPHGTKFARALDKSAVRTKMDANIKSILDGASPIMRETFNDLIDQIERKKIVKNQDSSKIEELKLKNLAKLKQLIKANLRQLFKDGFSMAQAELNKGEFRTPLADEEFLSVLEDETFQFIGDWEYNVRKDARKILFNAIKDGTPLSEVLDKIEIEGAKNAEASIERYVRTKTTEVLNRGRQAYFNSSDVIVGYELSAIDDGRTSDICSGLNGRRFPKGSEPVPPLHFNCRSVLIPITKYDEEQPDDEIPKSIEEMITDGGFSIK